MSRRPLITPNLTPRGEALSARVRSALRDARKARWTGGPAAAGRILDDLFDRWPHQDPPVLDDDAVRDLVSCHWMRAMLAIREGRARLTLTRLGGAWVCCAEILGRLGPIDPLLFP